MIITSLISITQVQLQPSAGSSSSADSSLLGYLQNVSPTKVSTKGSEYFTFIVQQKDREVKAICFSPKKTQVYTVESKAESSKPCKISKFANHSTDENVVWINQNTEIDDALETNVDFPFKELHPTLVNPQQVTVKDLDVIKVFESVTV